MLIDFGRFNNFDKKGLEGDLYESGCVIGFEAWVVFGGFNRDFEGKIYCIDSIRPYREKGIEEAVSKELREWDEDNAKPLLPKHRAGYYISNSVDCDFN